MVNRGSRVFLAIFLVSASVSIQVFAQSGTSEKDSLRTYELSEIVVGGTAASARSIGAVRRISIASIVRADTPSADRLVILIPSAHLQTNSRGESLVYIRSAGERQVAVFFDGALLNVPWDYRIDMSLIPTGMLGGVSVSRGIPSVIYGANVIGGAINLQSRSMDGTGSHAELTLQRGSNEASLARVMYLRRGERWSGVFSAGHFATDGVALPRGADLPFSQADKRIRANTDRRISNAFARISHLGKNDSELGLSVLHVDSEKGIAPEGHLDPAIESVRFWRYPLWRNTMVIANARSGRSELGQLRGTFWLGHFDQAIDAYSDVRYTDRTDRQEDEDRTVGVRMVGDRSLGSGTIRASLNWLQSTHRLTDFADPNQNVPVPPSRYRFQQQLYSTGLEVEYPVQQRLTVSAGASVDGNATPATGDKPSRKPEFASGLTARFAYDLGEGRSIRLSAGRKVRFPTMRELFGEALNRFELNPELKPESSFQADLDFQQHGENLTGEIVLFYRRTFDTIDQLVVEMPEGKKRKRINLEGSRVLGVEAGGTVRVIGNLTATGHLSWMKPEAFENGRSQKLTEKPERLGSGSLNINTRWGGSFQLSVRHVGTAYGLSLDNETVSLPASTEFGARAAIRRYFPTGGVFVEIYAGGENLTDQVSLPQLGLPGIGREYRVGASVSF